jgi:hypothetical protein
MKALFVFFNISGIWIHTGSCKRGSYFTYRGLVVSNSGVGLETTGVEALLNKDDINNNKYANNKKVLKNASPNQNWSEWLLDSAVFLTEAFVLCAG